MDLCQRSEILLIPSERIVPSVKPKRNFVNRSKLDELCKSIRECGLLQPICVRPTNGGFYEIISGEMRFRACVMAGMSRIPSIVTECSDERSLILFLTENTHRQNLHFFEEAALTNDLINKRSYSINEVSSVLGKSPSYISTLLRTLKIPEKAARVIIKNGLTKRHAIALLQLAESNKLEKALKIIVTKHLNAAQSEKLIKKMLEAEQRNRSRKTKMYFKDIKLFVNTLEHAVDTMNEAGIGARKECFETENEIRYTVTIPKMIGKPSDSDKISSDILYST